MSDEIIPIAKRLMYHEIEEIRNKNEIEKEINKKKIIFLEEYDKECKKYIKSDEFLQNYKNKYFYVYSIDLFKFYSYDMNLGDEKEKIYTLDNGDIVKTTFNRDRDIITNDTCIRIYFNIITPEEKEKKSLWCNIF